MSPNPVLVKKTLSQRQQQPQPQVKKSTSPETESEPVKPSQGTIEPINTSKFRNMSALQFIQAMSTLNGRIQTLNEYIRVNSIGLKCYQSKVERIQLDAQRAIERLSRGLKNQIDTVTTQKAELATLEEEIKPMMLVENAAKLVIEYSSEIERVEKEIDVLKRKLSESAGNERIRAETLETLAKKQAYLAEITGLKSKAEIEFARLVGGL